MDHTKSSREKFRDLLFSITKNVYFQPPSNVSMKFPAIRYSLSRWSDSYANNKRYCKYNTYTVTVIDANPDSVLVEKMQNIPNCVFDRQYVSNGKYHTVFTVNY